ncbi:MAG: phosphoribosyltransferase [Thermoanaerobaculia bacterium]
MIIFANRAGAGRLLAEKLRGYAGRDDVVVLALPRGGVPVAYEVAKSLKAPLDVFVIRRVRTPGNDDVAIGSIASGGTVLIDDEVLSRASLPGAELQYAIEMERGEVTRREKAYRDGRLPLDVNGRTVILVDDGLSPTSNMRAAVKTLRRQSASRIVVAIPVGDEATLHELKYAADEVICLSVPYSFRSVSNWYDEYPPVWDDEVRDLLSRACEAVGQPVL